MKLCSVSTCAVKVNGLYLLWQKSLSLSQLEVRYPQVSIQGARKTLLKSWQGDGVTGVWLFVPSMLQIQNPCSVSVQMRRHTPTILQKSDIGGVGVWKGTFTLEME